MDPLLFARPSNIRDTYGMNSMQLDMGMNERIVVYHNPAATEAHEQRHKYFAVAPEGCGSYGSTPEEACKLLEVVRRDFKRGCDEVRRVLIELANERIAAILKAGGTRQIDAG